MENFTVKIINQSILSKYKDLFLYGWANTFSQEIVNAFEYPNRVAFIVLVMETKYNLSAVFGGRMESLLL